MSGPTSNEVSLGRDYLFDCPMRDGFDMFLICSQNCEFICCNCDCSFFLNCEFISHISDFTSQNCDFLFRNCNFFSELRVYINSEKKVRIMI